MRSENQELRISLERAIKVLRNEAIESGATPDTALDTRIFNILKGAYYIQENSEELHVLGELIDLTQRV